LSATAQPPVTPERISAIAWGYTAPLIIEAAVHQHIFDLLEGGAKNIPELAALTGASPRGLRAILYALAGFNLLAKDADGRFSLTPESSAFLVSTRPGYMGGLIRHTSTQLIPLWLKLNDAVMAGKPAAGVNQEGPGAEFFHHFVMDIFPMSYPSAQALAAHLAAAGSAGPSGHLSGHPSGQPARALDLAAGSGVWGIALAEAFPDLRVTAVDWPGVLDVTRQCVERHGFAERFTLVPGDLLEAPFGSGHDVAILGHILHSEGERRGRVLLSKTFEALAPGGTIAIAEFLVNEDRSGPPNGLVFAVNMLVATEEGDTWSFAEIARWLEAAGFENPRTMPAPGPSPLILANRPA
jgi:3-hydroxy-5-methyl-1-naphthoate 3-O-methyltransferase